MESVRRTLQQVGTGMEMLRERYSQSSSTKDKWGFRYTSNGVRFDKVDPIPERLENYLDVRKSFSILTGRY